MNKIQGEDERALVELFTAWLDGEYDKESFLFGFHFDKGQREGSVAGYRNMATGFRAGYLAALSFRPAEPDEMEGMQSCGPNGPEGHDAIPRKPAQAALASERAKREGEARCVSEAINVIAGLTSEADEDIEDSKGRARATIRGLEVLRDRLADKSESPAPDAAALREALDRIKTAICDTWTWNNTLVDILTTIDKTTLLRSEPRGEEGRV